MSDLRKAAEMALDSMEFLIYHLRNHHRCKHLDTTWNPTMSEKVDKSFEALRQALAQPEQDELLKQGWRQCAIGQRTTQYCGMAEQARLEEREACAKVCDEQAKSAYWEGAYACAASIRARSEK